jgi:hypothetical protein
LGRADDEMRSKGASWEVRGLLKVTGKKGCRAKGGRGRGHGTGGCSLQDDFANEKPLLQHYLEGRGHVCLFLPKFHCELNLIEMLWGYPKYCKLFQLLFHRLINLQAR